MDGEADWLMDQHDTAPHQSCKMQPPDAFHARSYAAKGDGLKKMVAYCVDNAFLYGIFVWFSIMKRASDFRILQSVELDTHQKSRNLKILISSPFFYFRLERVVRLASL